MIHDVTIGKCRLICADCEDIIKSGILKTPFDLVLTDPPYGLSEANGKNHSRVSKATPTMYTIKQWDNNKISDKLLSEVVSSGLKSIVFGGNFYNLPPSSCWLVWDKNNYGVDFADCELAWTNITGAVRLFKWTWNGMLQENMKEKEKRLHPTQKPVPLMRWCIYQASKKQHIETVFDPFMGSGTTGVACVYEGKSFIGIEKDQEYFDYACKRIKEAYECGRLF